MIPDADFHARQLDKLRERRDKQLRLADTAQSNSMRDWHLNEVRALTLDVRKLNGADKLVRALDKDARRREAIRKLTCACGYAARDQADLDEHITSLARLNLKEVHR